MLHAIGSSQAQLTFMPPLHFSNFMVQRGTIIMFMPVGIVPVEPIAPVLIPVVPIADIPVRSTIIPLFMVSLSPCEFPENFRPVSARPRPSDSTKPPPPTSTLKLTKIVKWSYFTNTII